MTHTTAISLGKRTYHFAWPQFAVWKLVNAKYGGDANGLGEADQVKLVEDLALTGNRVACRIREEEFDPEALLLDLDFADAEAIGMIMSMGNPTDKGAEGEAGEPKAAPLDLTGR